MQQFAVIGLGRFGFRIALGLSERGAEVIAADRDVEKVEDIKDHVTAAVALDATDEAALRELNVGHLDAAVVAIGKDVESSILTTALLKDLGVPTVVSRAYSELQAKILERVGADRVVYPEDEVAMRVVRALSSAHLLDVVELSGHIDLAQVVVPNSFVGHTLQELDLRKKLGIWVVMVRRKEGPAELVDAEYRFAPGDCAYVMGSQEDITRLDELD